MDRHNFASGFRIEKDEDKEVDWGVREGRGEKDESDQNLPLELN